MFSTVNCSKLAHPLKSFVISQLNLIVNRFVVVERALYRNIGDKGKVFIALICLIAFEEGKANGNHKKSPLTMGVVFLVVVPTEAFEKVLKAGKMSVLL